MFPPHVFNCIQSLTENIPNKHSIRHSKKQQNDKDTLTMLEKLFPLMKNSKSDLTVLTDLVGIFIAKEKLDEDSDKQEEHLNLSTTW